MPYVKAVTFGSDTEESSKGNKLKDNGYQDGQIDILCILLFNKITIWKRKKIMVPVPTQAKYRVFDTIAYHI